MLPTNWGASWWRFDNGIEKITVLRGRVKQDSHYYSERELHPEQSPGND